MEWIQNILDNTELEDENTEEIVERIKQEFPKHAVPKEQYNKKADKLEEVEAELEQTEEQLNQTSEQLEDLESYAEENEELQEEIEQIKEEKEQFAEDKEQRIKEIQKKSQLEKELLASNVPEDAVDLLVSDFNIEELELDDNNKLKNIDEHKEEVRKKRPSLFGEKKVSGQEPVDGDSEETVTNINDLDNMSVDEINRNWDQISKSLDGNK